MVRASLFQSKAGAGPQIAQIMNAIRGDHDNPWYEISGYGVCELLNRSSTEFSQGFGRRRGFILCGR
jgi:hypothetical protein